MSAPLRFLALTVAGWAGLRALMLVPDGWIEPGTAARARSHAPPRRAARLPLPPRAAHQAARRPAPAARGRAAAVPQPIDPELTQATALLLLRQGAEPAPPARPALPAPPLPLRRARAGRWSASAWLLARPDGAAPLAAGGTLGGSQAGLRLGYRLSRPLSLAARISSPLPRRGGAEAALGIEWRPLPRLPLALLAERRQAVGRHGRSAFALMLHGGASRPLGRLRLDAYGQAGIVGTRSRDLFADGAARLGVPLGDVEVGASVSGGAQPGVSRIDMGPQLTLRLGDSLRLTGEWRFRIAGEARPGSGPALTLAGDF